MGKGFAGSKKATTKAPVAGTVKQASGRSQTGSNNNVPGPRGAAAHNTKAKFGNSGKVRKMS